MKIKGIEKMREFKDLKIAVAGTGYVGLSIATLLAQHDKVTAVDFANTYLALQVSCFNELDTERA